MPGLTFVQTTRADGSLLDLDRTLQATCFDARYACRPLLRRDGCRLYATAYPAYPIEAIETDDVWIALEGRLYGLDASKRKRRLMALAALALDDPVDDHALTRRLLNLDGDFVAFCFDKHAATWAFFNDPMGRLPLYAWSAKDALYVSREFTFFTQLRDGPGLDTLGMAQQLMFSYPLGCRTLLDGVTRLPPGTLLRSGTDHAGATSTSLHTFHFGEQRHATRSLETNARCLAELFEASCNARARSDVPNVVALSGGLDSRAVALGLQRRGVDFETATFAIHDGSNQGDVDGAEALAHLFDFSAHTFVLAPSTGHHLSTLLRAKGGLNQLDLGFVVQFLDRTRAHYDAPINFFTGDVGIPLRDLRPDSPVRTPSDLLQQIVRRCWFSPALTARLTGLSEERLLASIRARLADYPEERLVDKYVHFLYEWIYKFSCEGEDRNRYYFWQNAPLLSLPFFRRAIHCPFHQKANFALYRAFLKRLSPHSLDVGYSDFLGLKMTPWRYQLYKTARAVVRSLPPLKRFLDRFLGRHSVYSAEAPVLQCMHTQLDRCPAIGDHLDTSAVRDLLKTAERHPRHHLDSLLTLLSVIERHYRGASTLDDYRSIAMQ